MKWVGKGFNEENTASFAVQALRDIFGNPAGIVLFSVRARRATTGSAPRP